MRGIKKLWVTKCRVCGSLYERATRHNKLCGDCRDKAFKERGHHLAKIKYGGKKMIEDEELGLKIAENEEEAIIKDTIEQFKKRIPQQELALEIDKMVLDYLYKKAVF